MPAACTCTAFSEHFRISALKCVVAPFVVPFLQFPFNLPIVQHVLHFKAAFCRGRCCRKWMYLM